MAQGGTEERRGPALQWLLGVGALLAVLLALWLILRPLAIPIIWAGILAFLLQPLQQALTRRTHRPSMSAGIITGLTPVAIFVPLTLLGLAFASQVAGLTNSLQGESSLFDLAAWIDPAQHPRVAAIASWFTERFNIRLTDLQQYFRKSVGEWTSTAAKSSGLVFLGTAGVILKFFIMLFILFFALRDGPTWFRRAATLIPLERGRRNALLERLGRVLRAVVYGCGVTALVQGTLVAIGFAVAGLQGFVVFGVLAAVCALLPFGGAALIWVPATLYLFATGRFGWGVFMLVWGGVVSTSDNFIRPVIISRYTPVPTLLVFLGVIGGVAAFGPLGFVLGPVLLVLAVELFRFAESSMARRD